MPLGEAGSAAKAHEVGLGEGGRGERVRAGRGRTLRLGQGGADGGEEGSDREGAHLEQAVLSKEGV